MSGFGVPAYPWQGFLGESVPKNFATFFVDGDETPLLGLIIGDRIDASVKAHFQVRLVLLDGGGDIDSIVPKDG